MASTNTAEFAQQTAELRTFQYLLKRLGAKQGVNGHLGEFPKDIYSNEKDANEWMYAMGGGDVTAHLASERPLSGHKMDAQITFRCVDRARVIQLLGLLRNILPANEAVDGKELAGIQEFARDSEPAAPERDVVLIRRGRSKGGELRVWKCVQPLYVVFNNQERIA